ncbi:hypothetical protein Ancab_037157 [Ancistrocladus abbreviatus]
MCGSNENYIGVPQSQDDSSSGSGSGSGGEASSNWNACTKDGSLDWHGRPAIKGKSGGWKSGILLLVNQGLVNLAFGGVEVNMVLFSKSVLRQTNAEAANSFSRWMGTVYLFSLMGAFLSDSYLGRYLTCFIFQVVLTIGLVLCSLVTQHFLLKPHGCGTIGHLCDPHSPFETAIFYISIYLIALGNGASEPALATFGSDQFDEEDPDEKQSKTSFFSYFYVALNLGALISETVLVYLETMGEYVLGFWISAGSGIAALILLLTGTLRYRHFKPSGKCTFKFLLTETASMKVMAKMARITAPEGYYTQMGSSSWTERPLLPPSDTVSLNPEKTQQQQRPNPWRLCAVTQVEEVKCVLRLLPIWLCIILSSVVFIQMMSLFVEQGAAMNTAISSGFHFPPASMTAFDIISTSTFILFYHKLILPLFIKITKKKAPKPPTELQRIGIGLAIAVVAMVIAGLVEQQRRKYAVGDGREISSLSIFWQTPQYILVGVAEAFIYVAQWEFFSKQTPDGLKSIGLGLCMSSSAMGSYVCSMILTVVMGITSKDGKPGWVPPNLNDGRLDRFFFLSACLTALNLGVYIVCARRYKCIELEKRENVGKEMEVVP